MRGSVTFVLFSAAIIWLGVASKGREERQSFKPEMNLSAYGFFEGALAELSPAEGVIPYDLNTPLFTDYAYKARFVKIPEGQSVQYEEYEALDFPVGSTIIKNFYYPKDFRKPAKGRRIIETRLLVKEEDGWSAWPYIWNDQQTEAYLEVTGGVQEVAWVNAQGKKNRIQYVVPNKNQCKGCHVKAGVMKPIGPAARHLNKDFQYPDKVENQLAHWQSLGLLSGLPKLEQVPKLAVWDDPATGSLDQRARAWLDINCGHCHSKQGPANTSGLFLDIAENNPTQLGIMKPPVAAGRGAGKATHDIVPGKPSASILVYRMESDDPGIRMPELGRTMAHKEGLDLIKEWIRQMPQ